jgi:hypothetical protein
MRAMKRPKLIVTAATLVLLTACAVPPSRQAAPAPLPAPASPPEAKVLATAHYRCDHDIAFTVRFADDSAQVDAGPRGSETLLRDAGGESPQQTVYSSTDMKVEFGLGPDGREAQLNFASPPIEAYCARD